jgi:hypothetical protein
MPRKPAGTAIDPRNGSKHELQVITYRPPILPDSVKRTLHSEAIFRWDQFVNSPVAKVLDEADHAIAIRWIEALNRSIRLSREADQSPLIAGSQGQEIANPLYRIADAQTKIAQDCERQLGIGPKNRADLGVTLVQGKPALDQMNAELTAVPDEEDPRVIQGD